MIRIANALPKRNIAWAVLAGVGFFLVGCNGSDSDDPAPAPTGEVSMAVTDAPVDGVNRVKVTFNRVELKPAQGDKITVDLDPPVTVSNLLDLTGNAAADVLGKTTVPAGDYNYMRLYMVGGSPSSEVEEDTGGLFDLLLPGQQAGAENRFLQLVSGFTVPAGGSADFTVDIDLRKALTKPSGKNHYLLRPALRVVNNVEVGTIRGSVDSALLADTSCNNNVATDEGVAVYLYEADVVAMGDVFVDENGQCQHCKTDSGKVEVTPLTTANVKQNAQTGSYEYTVGFVEAGEYKIALTCQSLADDPEVDDDIGFLQSTGVSVAANQTTEVNFTASP